MNGTKVPKTSKILIANCNFFGANNNDNDQSHLPDTLITWDEVCIQKCDGSLRIRRTKDVNAVLLEKHG